jgi:hypothetical protein
MTKGILRTSQELQIHTLALQAKETRRGERYGEHTLVGGCSRNDYGAYLWFFHQILMLALENGMFTDGNGLPETVAPLWRIFAIQSAEVSVEQPRSEIEVLASVTAFHNAVMSCSWRSGPIIIHFGVMSGSM